MCDVEDAEREASTWPPESERFRCAWPSANHFAGTEPLNPQNNPLMRYHWMVPMDEVPILQMRTMKAREVDVQGHLAGQQLTSFLPLVAPLLFLMSLRV